MVGVVFLLRVVEAYWPAHHKEAASEFPQVCDTILEVVYQH